MHKQVTSAKDFKEAVLQEMQFRPFVKDHCTLYQDPTHPEHGFLLEYERPGYYTFGIGDYTIPHNFMLSFDNSEHLIRFGTVYHGITNVQLEDKPVSAFHPSSFFTIETNIKGRQAWKAGQHYHGAEFTIHKAYFEEVIRDQLQFDFHYDTFIENYTYRYLPLEVLTILEKVQALAGQDKLHRIHLESYLLQCIAIIIDTVQESPDNNFTKQLFYGKVKIGTGKYLHMTSQDIRSIQQAKSIIVDNLNSPPSIEALSEQVLLNPQKLKAGFRHYYHMPIGQFITSARMSMAANLLCTSDLTVAEIGETIGYPYTSNFIKAFQKVYHSTPLQFRHNNRIQISDSSSSLPL